MARLPDKRELERMTDSAERGGAKAPSLRTTLALLRIGPFDFAGRIGIALLYATRWLRSGLVALPLRHGGELYVSRHTLESDFQTLREIFIPRKNAYGTSYAGATVLDIGAHKGYYGAYALLNGASRVYSYEPASDNYVQLESHPFARCSVQAMLEQLGRAGFVATAGAGPVLRLARPGPRA